jgi:hypothetical protein
MVDLWGDRPTRATITQQTLTRSFSMAFNLRNRSFAPAFYNRETKVGEEIYQ